MVAFQYVSQTLCPAVMPGSTQQEELTTVLFFWPKFTHTLSHTHTVGLKLGEGR